MCMPANRYVSIKIQKPRFFLDYLVIYKAFKLNIGTFKLIINKTIVTINTRNEYPAMQKSESAP